MIVAFHLLCAPESFADYVECFNVLVCVCVWAGACMRLMHFADTPFPKEIPKQQENGR
uniref:Uncharacterized protein n=1 Tax=Anopheles minimus TaxID=112268 RepID=A0A182WN78_9DIPT